MATIAESLAALAALEGFTLTDEQIALAKSAAVEQCRDAAVEIVSRKFVQATEDDDKDEIVSLIVDATMELADMVSANVKSNAKGVRGGEHTVKMFAVETPVGKMKIELTVES